MNELLSKASKRVRNATVASKITTLSQANLLACFILMAVVLLFTGIAPKYLDYFANERMELAENHENDKETEEKEDNAESDKDDCLNELLSNTLWYTEETATFHERLHHGYCSYIDIFTPPPEQV